MDSRFSRNGSAARGLVIMICTMALAFMGYLMQLPPSLRAREATQMSEAVGSGLSFGVGLFGMSVMVGALLLLLLTILIPYYVYQTALACRRSAETLERVEELLRERNEQSCQTNMKESKKIAADDGVETYPQVRPTIYPQKTPEKITRMR